MLYAPLPPPRPQVFMEYAGRLWTYLGTLENRLFSEGLHVLGAPPTPSQLAAYLDAYYGEALPPAVLEAVEAQGAAGLDTARQQLERAWAQVRSRWEGQQLGAA